MMGSILDQLAARPRMSDAEWALAEFGVAQDVTPCKRCRGSLTMDNQPDRCAPNCWSCGRPWDRVCHGWHDVNGAHTCEGDGWARPRRRAESDPWLPSECLPCAVAPKRAHRMAQIPQVFAGLEDELALARDGSYRHMGHRQDLEQALGQWSRKALLVWGPCGSGKSIAVLRWAIMQHIAGASVAWVRSRELVRVHKRFGDRDEGATLLRKCARARVLVIDEFQASGAVGWTENTSAEMNFALQDRLDGGGLRTVLITNRTPAEVMATPEQGGSLSQMVLSRWQSAGRVVQCDGDDMRGGG